jgi:Fe-S oxidoreductase
LNFVLITDVDDYIEFYNHRRFHETASSPEMIVTANIGCLMHLQKGTKIPVKHWIELLGN